MSLLNYNSLSIHSTPYFGDPKFFVKFNPFIRQLNSFYYSCCYLYFLKSWIFICKALSYNRYSLYTSSNFSKSFSFSSWLPILLSKIYFFTSSFFLGFLSILELFSVISLDLFIPSLISSLFNFLLLLFSLGLFARLLFSSILLVSIFLLLYLRYWKFIIWIYL